MTWANTRSYTPRKATRSTIVSTTNPTQPALEYNINIHKDKSATNCLRYGIAFSVLQCLIVG
jgi:hypothetical protein